MRWIAVTQQKHGLGGALSMVEVDTWHTRRGAATQVTQIDVATRPLIY
jgi:hypothetical protein